MVDWIIFLPMLTMGLVSSAHCIGMCGGIMGALTVAIPIEATHKRWQIVVAYNVGRITSYSVMGLILGLFVHLFSFWGGDSFLRILAGALLIATGFYLADWWRGLTYLERGGRYLWLYLQPLGKGLLPVNSIPKALLLGALWGWLPCGLVYSALALAITQTSPLLAAGAMLTFGIGTLPAVLLAGIAAQQLTRVLQKRHVRVGLASLIIIYGCWTIFGSSGHAHHHHMETGSPSGHEHMMMNDDGTMMGHDHMNMIMIDEDSSQASSTSSKSSVNEEKPPEHHHHME